MTTKDLSLNGDIILDTIAAHLAILDRDGVILKTNRAWQEFGRDNNIGHAPDSTGINYLELCDRASGYSADKAHEVAAGIRSVIAGKEKEFTTIYPCHGPGEQRWFYLRVKPLDQETPCRVILSHENITPLLEAREKLEERSRQLEERNTALKVLLEEHLKDKQRLEESFTRNLHRELIPCLERLSRMLPEGRPAALIREARLSLEKVVNHLPVNLTDAGIILTPRESRIAQLICADRSSQEIADFLHISLETVQFHRKNLRRKMGLKNRGQSLRDHLLRHLRQ